MPSSERRQRSPAEGHSRRVNGYWCALVGRGVRNSSWAYSVLAALVPSIVRIHKGGTFEVRRSGQRATPFHVGCHEPMFRESVLVFFSASLPPERPEQEPDRRTQASNEGDDSDVKGPFPSGGGRESNPPRNPRSGWAGEMATGPGGSAGALAEADGNRTRPPRITRRTGFEDREGHQPPFASTRMVLARRRSVAKDLLPQRGRLSGSSRCNKSRSTAVRVRKTTRPSH